MDSSQLARHRRELSIEEIDAHAHLDHYDEPQEALARIESRRILTLANSMDPDSYERNLALAEGCPFVLPSFGIHPRRAPEHVDHLADLSSLIERSPMLGELGLDFHWVRDTGTYPHQIRVFEFLVRKAAEHDKIVNLHTKGAEQRILDTLRTFGVTRAIIHWYSGPMDVLDEMIAEGYLFTVGRGGAVFGKDPGGGAGRPDPPTAVGDRQSRRQPLARRGSGAAGHHRGRGGRRGRAQGAAAREAGSGDPGQLPAARGQRSQAGRRPEAPGKRGGNGITTGDASVNDTLLNVAGHGRV